MELAMSVMQENLPRYYHMSTMRRRASIWGIAFLAASVIAVMLDAVGGLQSEQPLSVRISQVGLGSIGLALPAIARFAR